MILWRVSAGGDHRDESRVMIRAMINIVRAGSELKEAGGRNASSRDDGWRGLESESTEPAHCGEHPVYIITYMPSQLIHAFPSNTCIPI